RLDAMERVGIAFKLLRYRGEWQIEIKDEDLVWDLPNVFGTRIVRDVDPYAYVVSANIQRRHLTSEQKRDLIAKLLKAKPDMSDRQIGKMAKADGKTAASVRDELEARAEIPHVEKRKDSKGRQQRASKPAMQKRVAHKPAAEPATEELSDAEISANKRKD